ncbi:MAG: glycosyltransferase family 4 protein, partial [Planctomycetales bacterium]|nr:glycosyltransferase family 4 protein [Planctomycetales bacterium]
MTDTHRAAQARPLKIVHSESSCGWGGQEIRILTEAAGLLMRGHDVRLLCPAEAPIFAAAQARGVPATALPIARRNYAALAAVRRWLAAHSVDVVNTHSSTDSWLFSAAAKLSWRAVPIVRTRHVSAPVAKDPFTRWLYTRAACQIVTTGEKLRQTLIDDNRFPPQRIVSVPTGIDTAAFCPGDRNAMRQRLHLPTDRLIVGIVATVRSWKGHVYLLEALHALARQDVFLLVVGEGPNQPAVSAKQAELNLTDEQVRFVGQQSDVAPWLQAC